MLLALTASRKFFVDAAEDAWLRAVPLHITLWTRPYTQDGLW